MVEIKFSAQVASARDKWLKLSADETLETVLEFLRSKYAEERNNNRRLGNLAAQTWIIRRKLENMPSDPATKIAQILEDPIKAKSQKSIKAKKQETAQIETDEASSDPTAESDNAMTVINILEEVSINDMRFFAGSRVEVSEADADRLIKAGKAQMNAQ